MTTQPREETLDAVREAFGELLGAERRLRSRDAHRGDKLSHSNVRALFALAKSEQATAGQLARAADLHPASVTGMLDHLERDGIVERRRSDADRRCVVVSLTDEGHALLDAKRERWRGHWQETFGDVPAGDLEAAARVLHSVAGMLDEL